MQDRLEELSRTHRELTLRLADPELLANPNEFREASQALAEIAPVVALWEELQQVRAELEQNQELLDELSSDDELYALANEERQGLQERIGPLEERLQHELRPKDPNDKRNVVLEVRAGTGGDEASLFAGELFRMYTRYAEQHGWKMTVIDLGPQ